MNQLALTFDERVRARRGDPATSKAAARRVKGFEGAHYRAIFEALIVGPGTIFEMAERTWYPGTLVRLDHYQVARRTAELYATGKIVKAGEIKTVNGEVIIEAQTQPSPSGNPCAVYRLP